MKITVSNKENCYECEGTDFIMQDDRKNGKEGNVQPEIGAGK